MLHIARRKALGSLLNRPGEVAQTANALVSSRVPLVPQASPTFIGMDTAVKLAVLSKIFWCYPKGRDAQANG